MATRRERVYYELTATDSASQVFRRVEGSAQRLSSAYTQLTGVVGALASAGAIGAAVRATVEAERAQNRLAAVIKATGGAAGIAAGEYDRMADALAEATQFDDESIRNAQATLLKFGNIHGEVFRNALKLSADLAAFMGTDVADAAQMIGRSLQSPTEGLTMMERQFGKLTEAQEKHINTLVRQGKSLEAQNAIIDLWQKKVGGVAETMNTGLGGALSGLSKGWNELLENMGKAEGRAGLVERSIRGLTAALKDLEDATKETKPDLARQSNLALDKLNRDIERLERDLKERRAQRRFYGGADVADDPAFAVQEARIQDLRALRSQVLQRARVLGMAGDAGTFDARDLRARQAPLQFDLGGKPQADAGADSALREATRSAIELAESAQRAAEELIYTWDGFGNRITITREEFAKIQKDQELAVRSWVESAQIATDIAEGMVYTWDKAGNRVTMTMEQWQEGIAKAAEEANRFEYAISNAFDRAVRGAEDATEVIKNLLRELAMVELQRRIFEPASRALSGALDELFSGVGAAGDGSVPEYAGGTDYVPRTGLALLHQGERVVPAGEGSGVTFAPQIYIDSRSDRAEVALLVDRAMRASELRLVDNMRRGGIAWRSARG